MQPTNTTTYNPFTGSAPASNDNAFQSAIDYLIANRQKPVFKTPSLFTKPVESNTDASASSSNTPTTNISSVIGQLFGDDYTKTAGIGSGEGGIGSSSTRGAGSFSSPFGPPSANDVARWSSIEGALRDNRQAASTFSGLLVGASPLAATPLGALGGLIGKYSPEIANYFGERSYNNFLADQDARASNVASGLGLGGVGTYSDMSGNLGTFSNQSMIDAYDMGMFGVTGAGLNDARGEGGGGFTDAGGGVVGGDQGGYDGNW